MGYLGGNLLYSGMASLLFAQGLSSGNKAFGTLALRSPSSARRPAPARHRPQRAGCRCCSWCRSSVRYSRSRFCSCQARITTTITETPRCRRRAGSPGRNRAIGHRLHHDFQGHRTRSGGHIENVPRDRRGTPLTEAPVSLDASRPVQEEATPSTHFSADNRVAIYTSDGCDECESMRRWLNLQDIRFTEHAIDQPQRPKHSMKKPRVREFAATFNYPWSKSTVSCCPTRQPVSSNNA